MMKSHVYPRCHICVDRHSHGSFLSCEQITPILILFFRWNRKKMTLAQKRARVAQKKAAFLKKMEEDGDDE